MAWFWIVLGLLAVMGSITWILPSAAERRQGERRMEALKLGMKVKILIVDDWVKDRLNIDRLSQYLIWTDQKPRPTSLWRIPGRDDPGRLHRVQEVGTYYRAISQSFLKTSHQI